MDNIIHSTVQNTTGICKHGRTMNTVMA